jgi:translation initiation factor 2-alpha kinase 4
VGRAGTAASHLKRYDIDRIFHKSLTGGHPRETLEATFDIVQEEVKAPMIEAEVLLVAVQVLSLLPSRSLHNSKIVQRSPLWYIRLSHTRLTDSILDLCGVPARDNLRNACFHIFSRVLSVAPHQLSISHPSETTRKQNSTKGLHYEKLDGLLNETGM